MKLKANWRKLRAASRAFMQKYNEKGQEIPDSTRNEVALGFRRPRDIHEMIQEALRGERMAQAAHMKGFETFEEANDFEVDEEPDPLSQYELREMHDELYDDDRRNHAAEKRRKRARPDKVEASVGRAGSVGEADKGDGESVEGVAGSGKGGKGKTAESA